MAESDEPNGVLLEGVVDVARAAELYALLKPLVAEGQGNVSVDLAKVERVDTSAAQIFMAASRSLAARGRKLDLVGANEATSRTLTECGLPQAAE